MITPSIRAYVDTCVFGGAFDEEFAVPTGQFFTEVRLGRLNLVVSPVVTDEIQYAPLPVRELYVSLRDCITMVDPDEAALSCNAHIWRQALSLPAGKGMPCTSRLRPSPGVT